MVLNKKDYTYEFAVLSDSEPLPNFQNSLAYLAFRKRISPLSPSPRTMNASSLIRDNVWLLLPWMVLHCVVIAFLTLGAAILSVHDKYILGSVSLFGAILLLFSWKSLRQLFMKMVDRQLKLEAARVQGDEEGCGIEEDEPSLVLKHKHELIFFGSKDRSFGTHPKSLRNVKESSRDLTIPSSAAGLSMTSLNKRSDDQDKPDS